MEVTNGANRLAAASFDTGTSTLAVEEIVHLAKTQDGKLLDTLQKGFKFIEEESFSSNFQGLFSEINLGSDKLGRKYDDRNAKLCSIISEIARGMALFSTDVDTLGDAYEYPLKGSSLSD